MCDRGLAGGSAFAGLGYFEAVAGAADGLEIAGIFGIGFDLFADAADVDVDGAGGDEARVAPDGVEEMIAAEDAAGMAGQVVEEAEFCGRGRGEIAADAELHGAGIDLDVFKGNGGGSGGALEAAEDGLDPGQQLAGREGLGDVVVGAELEAEDAVVFSSTGGDEDDGDGAEGGVIAQAAADVEAVSPGNHDVEQEEGGRLALGVGDEACGGGVDAGRKAGGFQVMLDQARDIGVILKHKDGLAQVRGSFRRNRVGGAFRPQPKRGRANRMQKLC